MGQSKGGGYEKLPTKTPEQTSGLMNLLQQALQNSQGAAQGFNQFLPGGKGNEAIANAAQQRFQQQTVPSILNSFGQNVKGSSSLNQALASGAANLNSDIAAQTAQNSLQASQGLAGLGLGQGQLGSQDLFAYLQKNPSILQQILGPLIGGAGAVGGAYLGRPRTNINLGGQGG